MGGGVDGRRSNGATKRKKARRERVEGQVVLTSASYIVIINIISKLLLPSSNQDHIGPISTS